MHKWGLPYLSTKVYWIMEIRAKNFPSNSNWPFRVPTQNQNVANGSLNPKENRMLQLEANASWRHNNKHLSCIIKCLQLTRRWAWPCPENKRITDKSTAWIGEWPFAATPPLACLAINVIHRSSVDSFNKNLGYIFRESSVACILGKDKNKR